MKPEEKITQSHKKRVLITGASGFIGQHFVKLFSGVFDVICLVRKKDRLTGGDLRDNAICFSELNIKDFQGIDVVIHLAGRAHRINENPADSDAAFMEINRDLTLRLADMTIKAGVKKFIFASSVKVMGEKAGRYDLDSVPNPTDAYGTSKFEAESGLNELFTDQKNAQCVILRLPLVYGPGNKGNMARLLSAAKKGIPLPLKNVKNKRSVVYVKNICSAIQKIVSDDSCDRPCVQTYFLCDGSELTSGELYDIIFRAISNKRGVFWFPETVWKVTGFIGDMIEKTARTSFPVNSKIVSRLLDEYVFSAADFYNDYNWRPEYSLKEGIEETVKWYLQ